MKQVVGHLEHHRQQALDMGEYEIAADLTRILHLLTDSIDPALPVGQLCLEQIRQLETFFLLTHPELRFEVKQLLMYEAKDVEDQLINQLEDLRNSGLQPVYVLGILKTLKLTLQTLIILAGNSENA